MENPERAQLLTTLLRDVSRSFYLTLRILPGSIRPQIGLAYLLARAADTIADTEVIPVEMRARGLEALRAKILGQGVAAPEFDKVSDPPGVNFWQTAYSASSPERTLLGKIDAILSLLSQFSVIDQRLIRTVLDTITSGQALDLSRFGGAGAKAIKALQTEEELDDYTFRVAGCVGEFWTRVCRAKLFPNSKLDDNLLLANGVRFGKGLQLVNILRDLPRDLRQGRCYLPASSLSQAGLTPEALLQPCNELAFRPLYRVYLAKAEEHLAAGWAYINALPRRCVRVRLACAWPVLIGAQTLASLRGANVLDASHITKVSRTEVRKIIMRSVLYYPCPKAWNHLFQRTRVVHVRAVK